MNLLEHLELEGIGGVRRASRFFLASQVEVKKNEVVSNLVALVSAINARMVRIPKTYPKPLSSIIQLGFNSILQAGGSVKIRFPSDKAYRTLVGQEKDDFIAKSDTARFTLIEDRENNGTLLIDVTQ